MKQVEPGRAREPISPADAAVALREIARRLDVSVSVDPTPHTDLLRMMYLGGPIDYDPERSYHHQSWRHQLPWEDFGYAIWCPVCEGEGKSTEEIMANNARALSRSRFAVFDLRSFSIGTPIEAWTKVQDFGYLPEPRAVVLIHPQAPGVFVRTMVEAGAAIADNPAGAWAAVNAVLSWRENS